MSPVELATTVSIVLAPIALIVGGIRATTEYVLRGRQQRIEKLERYWARFWQSEKSHNWIHLLSYDLPELSDIDSHERLEVLGLLEEISTSLSAGILRRVDVYNFFAWITNSIRRSSYFWDSIEQEPTHWVRYQHLCLMLADEEPHSRRHTRLLHRRLTRKSLFRRVFQLGRFEYPLLTFPNEFRRFEQHKETQ